MSKKAESILTINDMACSGCANTVQQVLMGIRGVKGTSVDHEKGTATVTYDSELVSTDDFNQVIEDAGYEFKGMKS